MVYPKYKFDVNTGSRSYTKIIDNISDAMGFRERLLNRQHAFKMTEVIEIEISSAAYGEGEAVKQSRAVYLTEEEKRVLTAALMSSGRGEQAAKLLEKLV